MKIFVCEFVTGGGLYREPLPASLAREGGLMLEALLGDLGELSDIELLTSRDARLAPLSTRAEVVRIAPEQELWQIWEQCLEQVDAFWPIAPESGGILARMSDLAVARGIPLLGCTPAAVRLAASKFDTSAILATHGIPVVPTFRSGDCAAAGPWVAKPDDGVGCEDSRVFHAHAALQAWLTEVGRAQSHVVQPYTAGQPASISMLCKEGRAWLLACNRQLIDMDEGRFHYRGSVLNGTREHWSEFEKLAQAVAAAMPGLAGYVGIDVLVGEAQTVVLEVNPRLTTSYAGLHRAMGCNPARLVVDLLYNGGFQSPPVIERNIVEVRLSEE